MTGDAADAVVWWPAPRPDAARLLVCFSYCGGGTVPFRSWAEVLPADVALALVCYPGREVRFDDPPADSWPDLLDDATQAVTALTDRPYLLFGHSLGARVAFEVALRLETPGPDAVIVSGAGSPVDWAEQRHLPPTVRDTDEELLDWLTREGRLASEVVTEPELLAMALSIMRGDLRAADSYRYVPGRAIRAPIHVLYGVDDEDVDARAAERWRPLTSGSLRVTRLPGGHFYTEEVWRRLPLHFPL
jgi:surfactin synthase thioesterase subunit